MEFLLEDLEHIDDLLHLSLVLLENAYLPIYNMNLLAVLIV